MMKPYIKGIPRCIFMYMYLRVGWYVSYTPHMYYADLRNVLILFLLHYPTRDLLREELSLLIAGSHYHHYHLNDLNSTNNESISSDCYR